METIATTRMSSKGQIVIPETIRKRLNLDPGAQFVVVGEGDVVILNGNIVVTDPGYDAGGVADVGAVYLYNGATGALISKLTGSTAGDQVGSGGVTVLPNGNYVVRSPDWDNGAAANAGAVTWGSGTTGVTGAVSAANSLVGSTADDQVGYDDVIVLTNGNYVVSSPAGTTAQQQMPGRSPGAMGRRASRARSRPPTAWWAARPTIRSAAVV